MSRSGRPVSLFDVTAEGDAPFTADASRTVAERVLGFVSAPTAMVTVEGASTGFTEFAGNAITGASDTRYATIGVMTAYGARSACVTTTRLDDASLQAAVAKAEAMAARTSVDESDVPGEMDEPGLPAAINPALWHQPSLDYLEPAHRIEVVQRMLATAGREGLVGGGVVGTSARSMAVCTNCGHFEYGRTSTSTCTVTSRTADGAGSGWASWKGEDWTRVDPSALAAEASEVADRTRLARALEPGRYTVVLSPVALAELVGVLVSTGAIDGRLAEDGRSVFSRPKGRTAVGEGVFDHRVTLSADPMDPEGGFLPFAVNGRWIERYGAVTWVRDGVLEQLSYDAESARARGRRATANAGALRMRGGETSMDAMIGSVERGIYVTRFSHVSVASFRTLLMSGVTRDGTFLIEHGKVTGAVRNLRFEDSPMRVLRNLTAIGPAARVPVGGQPKVMPGAVATDFLFIGMSNGA